jgi:ArsR family transcriptional regulator
MSAEPCCDFDDFLHAMGDENRQRILSMLQGGEMTVSELCAQFELAQPTISHHLAILRQVGLVIPRSEGKWIYYRANPSCVAECCQEILDRFRIDRAP